MVFWERWELVLRQCEVGVGLFSAVGLLER